MTAGDNAPLAGIRVLEIAHFIAGPFCAMQLADLGADVIKIERPGSGDPFRSFGGVAKPAGSHNFYAFNRSKRSAALDIGDPAGRDAIRRIARACDVVVENFRPGVLDRLGLGAEALMGDDPRLIYCSITGFSTDGPYRDRPAYDTIGQSLSGMLAMNVDPDDPRMSGPTFADQLAGMQAAYGILGALLGRARTGRGARVEISLLDAAMFHSPDAFTAWTQAGIDMGAETRAAHSHAFVFACRDGRLLSVHVSSNARFWAAFLDATGRQDLAGDPLFAERAARIANHAALTATLQASFRGRDRAEWLARLAEADVPAAEVHTIPDALADPEVRHLGLFHATDDAVHGETTLMRRAVRIDGDRGALPRPAPLLGAHTEEVLREIGPGGEQERSA